jgi:hypothetical protein
MICGLGTLFTQKMSSLTTTCLGVPLGGALERHEEGSVRVIPVILRDVD